MVTPFPNSAWNINIIGSGLTTSGRVIGNTIERLGSMPPQTGMPVYLDWYPVTPKRFIQQIDPNTGLITVAISGSSGQQNWYRNYPNEVNVWAADATAYGWPTGAGCIVQGHSSQVLPTGIGQIRGTDNPTGGGPFIYG